MYVYSWFIVLTESLLTVRLAVSEIKPVQSLTDGQTDGQTDRIVNYSNSRCACARGLKILCCINAEGFILVLFIGYPYRHDHAIMCVLITCAPLDGVLHALAWSTGKQRE